MAGRFARVLVVGDTSQGEAAFATRVDRALFDAGHAVYLIDAACDAQGAAVAASERGFRPTAVFYDARAVDGRPALFAAIRALGVPCSVFGKAGDEEGPQALDTPMRDERYMLAVTSLSREERSTDVLVAQAPGDAAVRAMEALGACAGVDSAVGLGAAWGDLGVDAELCTGAFSARGCRVCAMVDDVLPPTAAEAALRVAEGCVVVVDETLAERWGKEVDAGALVRCSAEGMPRAVETLLGDPAELGRVRAAQREWLAGLPSLSDAATRTLEKLDAEQNDASVLAVGEPVREVVAYGWFGADNFGDDLLLEVSSQRVLARFPEAVVRVIGANPERIQQLYGFDAIRPNEHYRLREMVRRASAVYFCGGLVFDDPFAQSAGDLNMFMEPYIDPAGQAMTCLTARLFDVPSIYLGAGIGPVAKSDARHALNLIGISGTRMLLRDPESAQLARDAGIPESQIKVCADLVLSAKEVVEGHAGEPLPAGLEPGGFVTVSLRDWPLNPEGFADAIARALDTVAEETGLTIAFVPFDPDDAAIHRRVIDRMKRAGSVVEVAKRLSPDEMLAVICASCLGFAMRLHCSVLHHVLGKPSVGLDYNEKVGSHYLAIGQKHCLLPLASDAREMADALLAVCGDYEAASADVAKGVGERAVLAEAAFDELFEAIEGHVRIDEPDCYHPMAHSWATYELRKATARAEAAEQRVRELEESTSYKIGRKIVRMFKK